VGVNKLPKVVTQQRRGRELNSQPASRKSNALATRLPSVCVHVCVLLCSNQMNDFEKQENFIREILAPVKEFWTSDVCRE